MKQRIYPTYMLFTNNISLNEDEVREYNQENDTNFDIYELHNIISEQDYEDFIGNLRYCQLNQNKYVMFGSLGLWNGRREIYPIVFESLEDAILKAIRNMDYITITMRNGGIDIECVHHDGRNNFRIKKLNEKGINCQHGDITQSRYHERIKGYLW